MLCTTLPLFHINALNTLAQAMMTGCSVVFETRFSASGFWPSMQQPRRDGGLPAGRDGADPAGAAAKRGRTRASRPHRPRTRRSGRGRRSIRRRGENISSYEVEQVLLSHPDVAMAAVFPVHSELAEDEVMAALVARPGRALDPAELSQFCESRLPYFAIPRYIDIVTDLPRTENGKVQKYKLREQGVSASTWDRQPAPSERPTRR